MIFDRLSQNRDELLNMRDKCADLIDNQGSQRVLEAIEDYATDNSFKIKKMATG